MTLIEVMVSMVILFIVFFGLMEAGRVGTEFNLRNAMKDEAVMISEQTANQIRNNNWATLSGWSGPAPGGTTASLGTVSRRVRLINVTYNIERNMTLLNTDTIRVRVSTWYTRTNISLTHQPTGPRSTMTDNVTFMTIIRNPAATT